LNKFSIPINE